MKDRELKQVDILRMCEPLCAKYHVRLEKNDLSQYVSGKVTPGSDKLGILGLALNVSEAWLMGLNVPIERDSIASESSDCDFKNDTGDKIKKFRVDRGLSQSDLADRVGTTMQNISQYERGIRKPKIETLQKIAAALDTDVHSLGAVSTPYANPGFPLTTADLEVIKKYRTLNACGRDIVDHVLDAPMYHKEPERIRFAARGGQSGTMSREEAEKIKAQPEIDDV
jgi:putative phage repressor